MKTTILVLALLVAPFSLALADIPARPADARPDIVETALGDARFSTLVTAVKAAGLVEALQGDGPFTVFAPTNGAFAELPEGTVVTLLQPEQKAALQRVLLFHVVSGKVLSSDLLKTNTAKTLADASVPIGLRVGNANVVQADIPCRNGVIHVIDAVLLPPEPRATPTAQKEVVHVVPTIETAIDRGVPVFNSGDHAGCARIYAEAAKTLLGAQVLTALDRANLSEALHREVDTAAERAWALRGAFDSALMNDGFKPHMEAPLPTGFPAPGPVGQVILKQYPQYRAARANGGGAFWTLFSHIKRNKVKMTAPVEMTMSGGMRVRDMAFLYEGPQQGSAGQQGAVSVLDLPAVQVLSIGIRGSRSKEMVRRAKTIVEKHMTDGGWKATGDWRVLGYNSPMVPNARKYWELQIPVGR